MQINGKEVNEALVVVGAVITVGTSFLRFDANPAYATSSTKPSSRILMADSPMTSFKSTTTTAHISGTGFFSASAASGLQFDAAMNKPKRNPVFYLLIAIIAGFTIYIATAQSRNAKKMNPIRTDEIVDKELQSLQDEKDKLVQRRIREGKDTEAFDQAQTAFIKGFRDFRQGNYKRAITNLDVARALYPDHPQATRYRLLAAQRLDQLVQDTMREARGQVERNQYKIAVSNYKKVIVLLDDINNPTFKEARLQIERLQEVLKGDL